MSAIHKIEPGIAASLRKPTNIWRPTLEELESLAAILVGPSEMPWVRKDQTSLIVRVRNGTVLHARRGAQAKMINWEMNYLEAQCMRILESSKGDRKLHACAFYLLRFCSIHALRDGNGRLARLLLAIQSESLFDIRIGNMMAMMNENEKYYQQIFIVENPQERCELAIDFIARLVGRVYNGNELIMTDGIWPTFIGEEPIPDAEEILRRAAIAENIAGHFTDAVPSVV